MKFLRTVLSPVCLIVLLTGSHLPAEENPSGPDQPESSETTTETPAEETPPPGQSPTAPSPGTPPASAPEAAVPGRIALEPPGEREFVLDKANLLTPDQEQQIRQTCDKLLTDKATPIIVVTINSMAEYVGPGMRIETFAMMLFNQWGIGHAKLEGQNWNTGILLLVSVQDRKARIELGAGWKREKDELCQQIMDDLIIPEFKQGDYAAGILAGVDALDKMARDLELPRRPRPWWHYALVVGFIGLAIFTAVSLYRKGSSGWAWVFWAAVFAFLGWLLYSFLTSSRSSSGGFSGGSFGGGFSGGGGASGSW